MEQKTVAQQKLAEKKRQQNTLIFLTIAITIVAIFLIVAAVHFLGGDKETPLEGFAKAEGVTNYVRLNVTYTDRKGEEHTGDIVVELDPTAAPTTVTNFQELVSQGFYDGLTFHRIISGFMIQGGDPKGTGLGGSDKKIVGEFSANGYDNPIEHDRGVISMARSDDGFNTASSQFFIVHKNSPHLDGQYAAFGRVVYGMETVDGIAAVKTNSNNKPVYDVVINYAVFVNKTA